MLGFGIGEILLVGLVVLLVVGPDNLPKFARGAGKLYGEVRRAAEDLRRGLVLEADRQDAEDRYEGMQERRARAQAEREAAEAANPGVAAQDEELPGVDDVSDDGTADAPAADEDLQALFDDPAGPYAAGRSLDEIAARWTEGDALDDFGPAAPRQPAEASEGADAAEVPSTSGPAWESAEDEPPPPGVTQEEWAELPPRIRAMLRGRG